MFAKWLRSSTLASDGKLVQQIWSLSWPTVIWSALEATLGLLDLLMVRSLGLEATAAVGIGRPVIFLVDSVAVALATGVIAVVSQAVGAKRWDTVSQVLRQCTLLLVVIALPVGVAGALGSRAILTALNADGPTITHAEPYLKIYFLGIFFSWAGVVGSAFYRSLGDALTPLKLATVIACLNIPLNYLLIHGLGLVPSLGVKGAALGTLVAKVCGAIAYFVLLNRQAAEHATTQDKATTFRLDRPLAARVLRIGAPMALAGLVRNGSRLVFLTIVGAEAIGMTFHVAVGVGLQVRLLSVLPALAFQVAIGALVGQAIGRGDYDKVRRLARRGVELLAIIMLVVVAAIIFCAELLARLFVDDESAAAVTATVLRWFAVAQFFSALNITVQGALMGAGDTLPNLRYTFFTQWIVMLPLSYATAAVASWHLHGPLVAWTLAPVLLLVLVVRRLRGEKWKNHLPQGLDP